MFAVMAPEEYPNRAARHVEAEGKPRLLNPAWEVSAPRNLQWRGGINAVIGPDPSLHERLDAVSVQVGPLHELVVHRLSDEENAAQDDRLHL